MVDCKKCGLASLLVVSNIVFLAVGIVFVAIGGWLFSVAIGDGFNLKGSDAPLGLILIGAILSIVALLGLFGLKGDSKCALGVYFGLLLVVFLGTVAFCGTLLFYAKNLQDSAFQDWKATDQNVVGQIEDQFQCCGFNTTTGTRSTDACKIYTKTCESVVGDLVRKNFLIIGSVLLGFTFFQLVALWGTCGYLRNITSSTAANSKSSSKSSKSSKKTKDKKERQRLLQKGNFEDL